MKKRKILALLLFFCGICRLFGISFQGLDLSGDNRLLFRTDFESEHAVYMSKLADLSLQQITAFPEGLDIIENGRIILAYSRLGAVRIPVSGGLPVMLPGFPSFATGNVPLKGRLQKFAASADGRWVLYVEPTSPAYGNLLLVETASGARRVISGKIELPALEFPARWSPDSRLFVYSKGGRLYYFPIVPGPAAVADERFRLIGDGRITAVSWGQQGDFFYLRKNVLYRISNPELFTRTIYGDFLSAGFAAGTIPLDFDSAFDRYWIAPDMSAVLMEKNGRNLLYLPLGENNDGNSVFPSIMIPRGTTNLNVLWSSSGQLTVTSSLSGGVTVWRFEINGNSVKTSIPEEIPAASGGALSPDGAKAVFWGESGLKLWDHVNWRPIQTLSEEPVLSCVWINNAEFIAGNGRVIEGINVSGRNPTRRLICLSGADEFGFEEDSGDPLRILARTGTDWFASDGRNPWMPVIEPQLRKASLVSRQYRVFLEPQFSGPWKNLPMVRNLASVGTVSLVAGHSANSAYTPARQHNSELKIALCFDLYDDDAGLSIVMDALNRFNVKATFFLNGDFIRRNPLAAAAIADAGHEPASLFYSPIDFSDSRYRVSPEFIAQGLARNEDEFYKATGKELNLLWHPPYFRSSDTIVRAAASSGYVTVARDIDCGDWLARDDALRHGIRQYSASDMIEQIIERKKNGAVIPLRLGLLPGGRDDYLFHRIDVLLDALVRSGCEVVPVSAVAGK